VFLYVDISGIFMLYDVRGVHLNMPPDILKVKGGPRVRTEMF